MKFKPERFSRSHRRVLVVSLIVFLLASIPARLGLPPLAMIMLILSSLGLLFALLEMRDDRITKGLWIISFGAMVSLWPAYIFNKAQLGESVDFYVKLISNIFSFAAAGAGGSIIAVHGDKYSVDSESATPPLAAGESRRIDKLIKASEKQTAWIKSLCVLVGLLVIGLFLNLLR